MKKRLLTFIFLSATLLQAQVPVLIKDIVPGPASPSIQGLTTAGGLVFFIAQDGVSGNEVWRTDGTENGTFLVKDINPGAAHGINYFPGIFVVNDVVFFIANDGEVGYELWKSDGTEDGTQLVKDINPGWSGSFQTGNFYDECFTVLDDILYFTANDGVHAHELWRTDGTEDGTYLVKDLLPGNVNSQVKYLTAAGDHIYFNAYNSENELSVWMSNGTEDGTIVLKENLWMDAYGEPRTNFFIEYNGYVYFGAGPDNYDQELWRTDGTPGGTQLFIEFMDDEAEGGLPTGFDVLDNKLIFWTRDFDYKFFVSDGTVAGTNVLIDNQGNEVTMGDFVTYVVTENRIYFQSTFYVDDVGYPGTWVTDLTSAGTFVLAQQTFDYMQNTEHTATAIAENVVFKSFDSGNSCWSLYQSNGTEEGTAPSIPCTMLKNPFDMVTFNGKVILKAEDYDGIYGEELWMYEPEFATAIAEVDENIGVTIFPNPADTHMVVYCDEGTANNKVTISNALGERVLVSTLFSNTQTIDISSLSAGIYFLHVRKSTQKFIKK